MAESDQRFLKPDLLLQLATPPMFDNVIHASYMTLHTGLHF